VNKIIKICCGLILSVFLAGCVTGPKLVSQQPNKEAHIGVVSFMGNDATIYDHSFFSGRLKTLALNDLTYDKLIEKNIVARLRKLGYKNSSIIETPESNPISNLSRLGGVFSFSSIHEKSVEYLKQAVKVG
jgi:hypothetical protein